MGKRELNFERFDKIKAIADATLVIGDKIAVYDVSAGNVLTATLTQLAALLGQTIVARVTATQTEVNAGKILIAAVTGKKIQVNDISILVTGNWATGTSVEVEDASANEVISYAQAQISDGAILASTSTGATLKASFGAPLTVSEALKATKTGSSFTAGTNIIFTISYKLV